ncbi:MAG: hypothetical protein ACOVO2_13010 [Emticicia sp.]|uniref:hypothetical protein n=1 Tax=Emticicia sp. TaxID=1930953 RepID=UPI003BA48FBF
MRFIKESLSILFLGAMMASCETQMIEPIDLENLEQGGYIRTISPLSGTSAVRNFNVSKANMAGTKMEIVAEAVTPDKGALFASYDLVVKFVDLTPANGNKSTTDAALKSIPASAFTKDATTGYPRGTIAVTGAEALAATKVAAADVSVGDRFDITGTMKLTNGKSFTASNTGANITGGDFYASPFAYRLIVVQ